MLRIQDDTPVYSVKDIIDTLKKWRNEESEETFEPILYFVSELTGISVDTLISYL